MTQTVDLQHLQAFFDADDIDWKPIALTKDRKKGLAAAYVTNRAIMDRLDEACGPANWRNEYTTGPDGGVLCGLSIRIDGEWITKWDGAENTDIEAVKGGLSNSMRRAAVHWGIGRYLYRLPAQWVPMDERGRFAKPPQIPPAYRPSRQKTRPEAPSAPPNQHPSRRQNPTGQQASAPLSEPSRPEASSSRAPGKARTNARATAPTKGTARRQQSTNRSQQASGGRSNGGASDADQYFIR